MSGAGYTARQGSYDLFGQAASETETRTSYGANSPLLAGYDPSVVTAPVDSQQQQASSYSYNSMNVFPNSNGQHHQLLMASVSGMQFSQPMALTTINNNRVNGSATRLAGSGGCAFKTSSVANNIFDPFPTYASRESMSPTPSGEEISDAMDPLLLMSANIFSGVTPPPSTAGESSDVLSLAQPTAAENNDDAFLNDISVSVSSLSLEPMSGTDIIGTVRSSVHDVLTRYIPCVDFLVQCQQELRKGLALATQKRRVHGYYRDSMTATQFYFNCVEPLPQQFVLKTECLMDPAALQQAIDGLQKLLADAKKVQGSGSEAVKNSFLGGMKDGESWGLRKWLSRNGNALMICTNLECLLNACQKLNRDLDSTKKLAAKLRPLAAKALKRLKHDIPASYQEVSAAHPYLPFFHRLESALRGMSNFDPEDDDVICIDDDDDDEDVVELLQAPPAKPPSRKRKRPPPQVVDETSPVAQAPATPKPALQPKMPSVPAQAADDDGSSSGESDDASAVEVVELLNEVNAKPAFGTLGWSCSICLTQNGEDCNSCLVCGKERSDDFQSRLDDLALAAFGAADVVETKQPVWPPHINETAVWIACRQMAQNLDQLAGIFEQNQQDLVCPISSMFGGSFWDGGRYASALRLFVTVLQSPDASHFVERPDEDSIIKNGGTPYSSVIKNPLCFRDIIAALIENEEESTPIPTSSTGKLPARGLAKWNMWRGMDLLQAIDLCLLNSLAYGKAINEGRSSHRSATNKLRKVLWNGISEIVTAHAGTDPDRRRECTPIRRSETSGFVIKKSRR